MDEDTTVVREPERLSGTSWTNLRLLLAGEGISLLGTAITTVALPAVAVLALRASTFQVALIGAAAYAPYSVLGLLAGVYVDRWRRRRVLLWADAGRIVLSGLVPVLWALGLLRIWYLIAAALLTGVGQLFFDTAFQAYLPEILPSSGLVRANSLLQGASSVATLGGPSVGGVLIQAVGAPLAVAADAASYAASMGAVLSIRSLPEQADTGLEGLRRPDGAATGTPRRRIRTDIAEGLRYTMHDRLLRSFLAAIAHYNVCTAASEALLVLFLLRVVRVTPAVAGVLLATRGIGALVGAAGAQRLVQRLGIGPAMTVAAVIGPALGVLLPFAYPGIRLGFFVFASLALGAAEVVLKVAGVSYRQATVPGRLLGRVVATNRALTWGLIPLGGIIAGVLGELAGVRVALLVMALLTAMTPVWLVIWPVWGIRAVDG